MRCLTLADALRERGAKTFFVSREHPGHLLGQIVERGHKVHALPAPTASHLVSSMQTAHAAWLGTGWLEDAKETLELLERERIDWLVVDHYALDRSWEQSLRPACERLMVMDDLADRAHDCDLLLDPTLGRTQEHYAEHVRDGTKMLLGPTYALLRPEFASLRPQSLARRQDPELRQILISMGGVDKDNATGRVLDALDASELPSHLGLTVVMGRQAPWLTAIQHRARIMRFFTDVRVEVKNMAELMAESDLAIGAAGGTSWERCCMGLPTIQFVVAKNQELIANQLAQIGAATFADEKTINSVLSRLCLDSDYRGLGDQIRTSSRVTDGLGAQRVAEQMLEAMS